MSRTGRQRGHAAGCARVHRSHRRSPLKPPGGGYVGGAGGRDARPQADEHAVEMAVARLRRGLGRSGIVETVVKRGYRLACDSVRWG
ncbi:hypothetical protein GCM10022214_05700 [Actinomadura miaoliensis]|uniref:OmpR/PhoB-type domain-containing protein n=1 Tax=Actinomadura miaoliensis TaxID=430685 RepID=A0ABP7V0C9_9ACTN